MNKVRIVALGALVTITACEGLKEAMTAHVDVAARAEGQELSVQRLADMMGHSQVPVTHQNAELIADVWVNYQLLGKAAADGDSMTDDALIDKVMWSVYAQSKTQKYRQKVEEGFTVDTSNLEAAYNAGRLLAARHILFQIPSGQEATGSDSVMRKAQSVLRQINDRNFAAMAKQYGSDGTKDVGGDLGVFPPEQMVPEFSKAVQALKPGEIGPLVKTPFGYHIVKRLSYAEARDVFRSRYEQVQKQSAESAFFAGVETAGKIEVKANAGKVVKEVAADLEGHKGSRTSIATSVLGTFTAGDVARWIGGMAQRAQLVAQIQDAPDSLLPNFVKSLIVNEIFLKQADSAGVKLDTSEVNSIRGAFKGLVRNAWAGLRISPELLADSAKDKAAKARLAASRIDGYMDRLLAQQEGYIDIPGPLADALREKYDGSVKPAGLARAVELGQKIRAASDSARAASQPKSAVPLPGDTSRSK